MDSISDPNIAKQLDEIEALREDNEALRGSAVLWRRLYERALRRRRLLDQEREDDSGADEDRPR
jgi:hypothetical protein